MPTIKKKKKNRLPECTIDLTTAKERMVLLMLALQAPVWYFLSFMFFHWIGYGIEVLPGLLLFYYVYSFKSTRQLIFQDDCLRMPGALRPAYLYSEISKIEIDPTNALRITTDNKLRKISLAGISREEAAKLWTLFATRCKGVEIDPEVRARLKNWVGQPVNARQTLKQSAELAAQEQTNDLQLTLNLKAHSALSQTFAYLSGIEKGYDLAIAKIWLACWSTAVIIYTMVTIDQTRVIYQNLKALLEFFSRVMQLFSDFLNSNLAFYLACFGTCGLVCLILFSMDHFLRKFHEADRLFIDYLGFTALLSTPTGSVPKEHLSWQSIASIKLYGSQRSDAGGLIEISAYNEQMRDRLPIQIPLSALTSNQDRQLFLETINAWGRRIDVDAKIRELMTPHADVSYTELWFSSLHSAPQLKALTPLADGARLLHHDLEIEKQLGVGGQAVTYLAHGSESDNKLVLKEFILPLYNETVKKRMIERFERDAKLLQSLDHPQVVKLHHYFIEGNRAFLVLEHIEGTTLKQKVLQEGPLSEAIVLELMRQMATILAYLHSCTPPVVHRDFTADNIVINDSGTIKLLDFDVATSSEQETTARAAFAGKQNYVPPEQFQGRPCPQSDIYALGATAFFLLTAGDPEPLGASHPANRTPVSSFLNHLVAYCTDPILEARCSSANELLAKLENQSALVSDRQ